MKLATTREYLEPLFADAGLVQLAHHHDRFDVTWHDSVDSLLATARRKSGIGNLYTTINAPKLRSGSSIEKACNQDIMRVTRIFFDFDPARPKGASSTSEEIHEAHLRKSNALKVLAKTGWGLPIVGKSGNGFHLQYRTSLPADEETAGMLRAIYSGLDKLFGDDVVKFDVSVKNPARLCRLYGSINRKADDRETAVWMPDRFLPVSRELVEVMANHFEQRSTQPVGSSQSAAKPISGSGDYNSLDIVAWFSAHGLYKRYIKRNIHAVKCPWEYEHTSNSNNDTVVFEPDGGWGGFNCKHEHCQGRNIRDVMDLFGDADNFCAKQWLNA